VSLAGAYTSILPFRRDVHVERELTGYGKAMGHDDLRKKGADLALGAITRDDFGRCRFEILVKVWNGHLFLLVNRIVR
jgi:hypothetical protein